MIQLHLFEPRQLLMRFLIFYCHVNFFYRSYNEYENVSSARTTILSANFNVINTDQITWPRERNRSSPRYSEEGLPFRETS